MLGRYFLLIISIILVSHVNSQITITLPVSQELMVALTISMQRLETVLEHFDTRYENKFEIYKRVQLTKTYLHKLSEALDQYKNVILGSGNVINGSKNIVIGNFDNINGSNNWIFVSSYTGTINGDLLLGKWRVQMDKSHLILINTRFAISFLDQQKNANFKSKYATHKRQLFKWDSWAHPQNSISDAHWGRFTGYNQWKTNSWAGAASQPIKSAVKDTTSSSTSTSATTNTSSTPVSQTAQTNSTNGQSHTWGSYLFGTNTWGSTPTGSSNLWGSNTGFLGGFSGGWGS